MAASAGFLRATPAKKRRIRSAPRIGLRAAARLPPPSEYSTASLPEFGQRPAYRLMSLPPEMRRQADGRLRATPGSAAGQLLYELGRAPRADGRRLDRAKPMVVHCYAGISRSTAGAYVAACALN